MLERVFARLDQLNEFERAPVTEDQLKGGRYFAGAFAGEHIAATEFVIGALFVKHGAAAFDVIVGLLVGNLLAVLSWTLVCVPIAMQTRLTLYWYLRRIGGPMLMVLYNVLNAVLYCVLGGAMITVAASAVRLPFGIPEQVHWYPEDFRFVLLVLAIGAVVVTLAILGFKRLAQFSMVCSPWMVTIFVAGGLASLPLLGHIGSPADFWQVAQTKIWSGVAANPDDKIGFWHIVAFAWICNLGMHIGLTDMALFRYAKHWAYGLHSSFGMFLGHYVAWVAAGIMGAAAAVALNRPLTELDSGSVAYTTVGVAGALCVVFAGWTTANPMLYRAGLALQVITPGWPRWLVTLIAGAITTVAACSPFAFTKMLDFIALYGLLLMPIGVVVFVEHWLFPRLGWGRFWATRRGHSVNLAALAAWLVATTVGFAGLWAGIVPHFYFVFLPVWLLTVVLYPLFAAMLGARGSGAETAETPVAPAAVASPSATSPPRAAGRGNNAMFYACGAVAAAALAACLGLPLRVFLAGGEGYAERLAAMHTHLLLATAVYFVAATLWFAEYERRKDAGA